MRDALPPARALLDAGVTLALATDANAGTYGSWSMPLVIGLGATVLDMFAGGVRHRRDRRWCCITGAVR